MKSLTFSRLLAAFLIGTICLTISCRKKQNTTARILVVDTSGTAVPNAMVRLWPNPDPVLNPMVPADTAFTGWDGYAIIDYTDDFNLGQAGFRVLDIEVRRGDSLYGEGIIKIVEEEHNEQTVVVTSI